MNLSTSLADQTARKLAAVATVLFILSFILQGIGVRSGGRMEWGRIALLTLIWASMATWPFEWLKTRQRVRAGLSFLMVCVAIFVVAQSFLRSRG